MTKKEYCKKAWEHLFAKGYKIDDKLPLGIINNEMAEFAQEIVKLFAIPDVSNRRELLIAYTLKILSCTDEHAETMVDSYLTLYAN